MDGFDYIDLADYENSYFYKHVIILLVILFFFTFDRSMKLIAMYIHEVGYLKFFFSFKNRS